MSILRCLRLSSSSSTPQLIKWIFTSRFILLNRELSSRSGLSLSSWASIFTPISAYISWSIQTSLGVTRVMASPSEPFLAVLPTRCTQSAMVLGMLQLMTMLTSAMSRPREVRSVVMRTRACPLLKAERLATRWLFFMKECSWVAGTSSFCRVSQMRVHSLQVFTKTMVLWRGLAFRRASRQPGLSCSVVKMQFWRRVLTVFLPAKVENFTKSSLTFSSCFSRLPSKFSSMVAVARRACLRAGIAPMMLLMLGRTFSSNSRSASSSTRISTRFSSSTSFSDFYSISASLPGVATTMCGYFSSWSYCMRQLTPPTISACLRLMPWPNTLICSWICMASSRLGATMTAKMLVGSLASSLSSGRPNAAVLPEPVCELMMTLLPCRMCGMVRAWMGVGVWYLIFSQVLSNQLDSFSLLNEDIIILEGDQMGLQVTGEGRQSERSMGWMQRQGVQGLLRACCCSWDAFCLVGVELPQLTKGQVTYLLFGWLWAWPLSAGAYSSNALLSAVFSFLRLAPRTILSGTQTFFSLQYFSITLQVSQNPLAYFSIRSSYTPNLRSSSLPLTISTIFLTNADSSFEAELLCALEAVICKRGRSASGWLAAKFSLSQTLTLPSLLRPTILSLSQKEPTLSQHSLKPRRHSLRTQMACGRVKLCRSLSLCGIRQQITLMFCWFPHMVASLDFRYSAQQTSTSVRSCSFRQRYISISSQIEQRGSEAMTSTSPSRSFHRCLTICWLCYKVRYCQSSSLIFSSYAMALLLEVPILLLAQ